jgi:hypothetical protein
LLICFLTACADVPQYYWLKYGGTSEQISRDNTFCADMTADKPSAYARGSAVYFTSLDQPAYQNCMQSLGYRKVTEEELQRERFTAASRPLTELNAAWELCERVIGNAGDVESCIRYMSLDVTGLRLTAESNDHESPPTSDLTTTVEHEDACLRKDPNDARGLTMVVSRRC